MSIFFLLAGVV